MDPVIIGGAFGILGAVFGAWIGGWFALRGARQQVEAVVAQTQGDVHERLYNQNLALLTVLAEHPDLLPYFYEKRHLDPHADPVDVNRVRVVAEMYAGFLELVALNLPQLGSDIGAAWRVFLLEAHRRSPALQQCLVEHRSWYSSVLHDILEEHPAELTEHGAQVAKMDQA